MAVVKRVGPLSALKMGSVVCAFLGLLAGMVCSGFALAGIPFGLHAHLPFTGIFALLPLILCPLFYGIIGGISALLGALFYNFASRWIGGLEVDIQ
ncbi:MAG TPA: hypothetical protein VE263_08415 [Candidatus Angelobacter sp.]|nr:hypothetical protein [Candidatus Angelobacter sp.]